VLRIAPFRRLWLSTGLSALADWLGVLAAALYARGLVEGSTAQGAVFGGVLAVRLLPELLPVPAALAARADRRLLSTVGAAVRGLLFASVPIAGLLVARPVAWVFVAVFLAGVAAVVAEPATRGVAAELAPGRAEAVGALRALTRYVLAPLLATLVLAALSRWLRLLGSGHALEVALYTAAAILLAAAALAWTVPPGRSLPVDRPVRAARRRTSFVAGLVPVLAVGVVVGTGPLYAASLSGGHAAFALVLAALAAGVGLGVTLGPGAARTLSPPRWAATTIVATGVAVVALALAPHLSVAVPVALVVGAGVGTAVAALAPAGTPARAVLAVAVVATGTLAGLGGSRRVGGDGVGVDVSSGRILLLAAGLLVVAAGVAAFRRTDDRPGVPVLRDLWGSLRGRPVGVPEAAHPAGLFVVFEGGEGAGKSTQAVKLAAWLRVDGRVATLTREPGATEIGARIRGILLDRASEGLAPRSEALLYAADRAHHVASVIRPALARGEVVISDRYVDSSMAYQGAGRALPVEEIGWLSEWATGGLVPDLVVLLDVDPAVGLGRASARGEIDRLEAEAVAFHQRVRRGFLDLAAANPQRYLVVDAATDPETIAARVQERVVGLLATRSAALAGAGS
jgi:dTMP kinase